MQPIRKKEIKMRIIRYQKSPLYTPASNFTTLRDEMDRLFDVAFPAPSSLQRESAFEGGFPVDLYQEKDAFVVRAELPGFRKEDLSVEVADGLLTLTGHQKTETPAAEKDRPAAARQERRVSRSLSLPEQIKAEAIQARYENGVLTITLPKREEVKPRQIAIDVK
jgi:HSP20 family protein